MGRKQIYNRKGAMTEVVTGVVTEIAGEVEAGQAAKVRKQLEVLVKKLSSSKFDIGELLHLVKKHNYIPDGFTTFKEYALTLGIKWRTADYLRRIAEVMEIVN